MRSMSTYSPHHRLAFLRLLVVPRKELPAAHLSESLQSVATEAERIIRNIDSHVVLSVGSAIRFRLVTGVGTAKKHVVTSYRKKH